MVHSSMFLFVCSDPRPETWWYGCLLTRLLNSFLARMPNQSQNDAIKALRCFKLFFLKKIMRCSKLLETLLRMVVGNEMERTLDRKWWTNITPKPLYLWTKGINISYIYYLKNIYVKGWNITQLTCIWRFTINLINNI